MKLHTKHATGQTGEFLVAAELARRGLSVALLTGNAEAIDLMAYGYGKRIAVQVKSAAYGDHQFNLGKFVHIEHTSDGGQIVRGIRKDLDGSIILALVQVAEQPGQDSILWTTAALFAELLASLHDEYLRGYGGRRPGKNPKSLHSAVSFQKFKASGICGPMDEILGLCR